MYAIRGMYVIRADGLAADVRRHSRDDKAEANFESLLKANRARLRANLLIQLAP